MLYTSRRKQAGIRPVLFRIPWASARARTTRIRSQNPMAGISPSEISRLQITLRRLLGSPELTVNPPPRPGLSVELSVRDEVIGTVHRDEDEGEVSYAVNIIVLEEDLPAK